MKTKIKILFPIALSLLFLWGYIYTYSAGGLKFFINYHRIDIGDSKERVVELLGRPDSKSLEFYLAQKQGYEAEYSAAKKTNSIEYLVWNKGIDLVYSIGFDPNEKVTINAHGGT